MPLNRAVCMQHLQMLVGLGYRYWNSGLVRNDKLILLVAKFGARFPIAATPGQRAAAKRRGQVNVQLVIFDTREQPGCCRWWLLATPLKSAADAASNSIYSLEPMKDAWEISLGYGPHFVLTRKVRDIAEFEHGKRRRRLQLRWTWELSKTTFQEWLARLEEAAKHAPGKLYGEFATLRTVPALRTNPGSVHKSGR